MTADKPIRHVALIGCGYTGTSAFFQLVDHYPVQEITIFEKSGRFGPGYPYQPDECRDYLINNTTDTMGLVPGNRRAFLEWLRQHPEFGDDIDETGHLPRALFGRFLESAFDATRTNAAIKGIKLNLIREEALAMREGKDGKVTINSSGAEIVADIALLTTGRCPDIQRFRTPPEAAARFIASHVMNDELDDLPRDATVHILGASLSAYDVVNRVFSPGSGCKFERDVAGRLHFNPGPNRRNVILCSRSGRLKKMQGRMPESPRLQHFTLAKLRHAAKDPGLTLEQVAAIIRREAAGHGAAIDWEAVADPYAGCDDAMAVNARAGQLLAKDIASARQPSPDNFLVAFFADEELSIWDAFAEHLLAPAEERRYRDAFETAVLTYAAPCPVPTSERLLALHRAGRLVVCAGAGDVALAQEGSHYTIAHAFGIEQATILVDATGPVDRNIGSAQQPPLIQSLLRAGLLRPYARGGEKMLGAAVDMATCRADGARNIYLANMLLWGPGFFTSSAFMMATIVERILASAFAGRSA